MSPAVIDRHRAIASLQEELEAIDWYDQRVAATDDQSLAEILAHNRDEEKEHAAMALEWLRRHDPVFDTVLRTYLFTEEPIVEVELEVEGVAESASAQSPGVGGSLGIGTLREGH
jgi:ferritin-like protein